MTIRIPYEPARAIETGLVLLVEDTLEIRETLRGYLRRMGHSVIEATRADEAAKLAQMPDICHILTDLMLEGQGTGLDLATMLLEGGSQTPLTIITGLPPDDLLRQKAAQCFPVMQKPIDYATLERVFRPRGMP